MRVNLVLHDNARGWVIEKLAVKLCEALVAKGVDAEVTAEASPTAQVNHFMIFHYADPLAGMINTMSITHVDDALKIDMIKRRLSQGVRAAICMSTMTVDQLVGYGVDPSRLTFALPAHDGDITPRRIVIGVTSNCPGDGRKREWLLIKLAEEMALDAFEFQFFGTGWDVVVPALEAAGAKVAVVPRSPDYLGDYSQIRAAVPHFDYYFYPGLDEGSLGTLDALAAGVKTIVTLQGFHLDLPNAVTHGFWDYPELKAIFQTIVGERQARIDVAQILSWANYAQRHIDIWTALETNDTLPATRQAGEHQRLAAPAPYPVLGYRAVLANPFRRQMALQFWIPGLYRIYLATRHGLGRMVRRVWPA